MLLVLVAAVFLIFYLTDNTNRGQKVNVTQVVELIQEEKVAQIYVSNGTGKILLQTNVANANKFPGQADYYFNYTSGEQTILFEKVLAYNETHPDNQIGYSSEVARASFLERALPYLSVIALLIFAFYMIRAIMSANSKNMSFGKTRAHVAQNVKVKFSDVAGIDEEKEELKEVVEFLKNPQKFTEIGAKIPKGILLVGLPGTGKTLLAKAIAGESNVPFFSISGSDFVEMFVGVGASRVRDLFDQAKKNSPCIVFIDEIDAVGRQRGAGLGGGNDEREQTLNQLLVQMDGFEPNEGIIVIAATNRSDVLDPALLRPGRFDRQIYVNLPDVKGREKIIEVHAKNKPIDKSVDFKTLARLTSGFTGADIENLLNEAAIITARSNRKRITMTDITEGINKVLMGPQKKSRIITEFDKKITACHESGHAIVGRVLDYGEKVQEVSIIPRGSAAGYTISRPDNDDSHMTYKKLNDTIAMMLGGRAAEELVMKDITTGASNDIERATKLARKMVTSWGMSKTLGTVDFGTSQEVFIGRDYQTQKQYSEDTAKKIDAEVKAILDRNYKIAKDIITKNMDKLKTMSEILLEKETIYSEEVDLIMKGRSAKSIIKQMDVSAEKNKLQAEKDRIEAELEKVKREQSVRIKTAGALKDAGVITDEEHKKVNTEADELVKKLQAEYDNIVAKMNKEKDANKTSKKSEPLVEEKSLSEESKKPKKTTQVRTTGTDGDPKDIKAITKRVIKSKEKEKQDTDKSDSDNQ